MSGLQMLGGHCVVKGKPAEVYAVRDVDRIHLWAVAPTERRRELEDSIRAGPVRHDNREYHARLE